MTYRYSHASKTLTEVASMEKPVYRKREIENFGIGDRIREYEKHLKSLKHFPTTGFSETDDGKEFGDGEFELKWFVKTTSYQGEGGGLFKTKEEADKKYNEWSKYNGQLQAHTYPPQLIAVRISKQGGGEREEALVHIIDLKEKERKEWADMCIKKQAKIELLSEVLRRFCDCPEIVIEHPEIILNAAGAPVSSETLAWAESAIKKYEQSLKTHQ